MFVTWREINGSYQATSMCDRGAERNLKRLWEEESSMSTALAFKAYMRPLEAVSPFKYLVRVITASYNDCP